MIKHLLAAAMTVTLIPTATAQATTDDALQRCRSDWPPDSAIGRYTLKGNDPGLTEAALSTITSGNVVRVIGTGRVHYGGFLGLAGEWGPEGNGTLADPEWHFPGASQYSAAGRWNPTAATIPFNTCTALGYGSTSAPQRLFLGVNDHRGDFGDNQGAYEVSVWVYHR